MLGAHYVHPWVGVRHREKSKQRQRKVSLRKQSPCGGTRPRVRRDVLAAAAAVLEESDWESFSIREVASRAGVSGGAVYQWFSGKREIWAHLQTARFTADTATVESWPDDLSAGETVHRLVALIAKNHTDLGRHRFEFARDLKGRTPDYALALTDAHHVLSTAVATRVRSVYPDGVTPTNHAARVSWLWAVGKGVGDHLIDARFDTTGVGATTSSTRPRNVCSLAFAPRRPLRSKAGLRQPRNSHDRRLEQDRPGGSQRSPSRCRRRRHRHHRGVGVGRLLHPCDASRAGVSTGAVYQWFSGKDEIFGELFDREIRAGLELIDRVPEDLDLETTVRLMIDWVVVLYEKLGRYELEFVEATSGRTGREIAPAMVATYLDLGKRADALLDRAAEVEGLTLVESSDDRITWFWAGCVGTAERLVVSAKYFTGERREQFLAFSAGRLTQSLLV